MRNQMAGLEFFFDFACPYAYLASTQIERVAERARAAWTPKPVLLGGLFKAVGNPQNLSETLSPPKAKHNLEDMHRFARLYDVPLNMPEGHPLRTVEALRALLAVGAPFFPLAHHFYRAYWVDGVDISQRDAIASVLNAAGHDAESILARAQSQAIKDELRQRTQEAIDRGVFGVPTFIVGEALWFGQDRLPRVEEALGGSPVAWALPRASNDRFESVDFWFDYSSPFTYVASERIDVLLGDAARWRPILLGGLFKSIGQNDVPLFAQSEAKRKHTLEDLVRQAKQANAPFRFPSIFPMNTILALRVTLAVEAIAPARTRDFAHRVFRAFWGDDRDISKVEVLGEILADLGLDAATILARSQDQSIKDALRASTEAAKDAGVFGAPTFVTGGKLFWGADRLELAARDAKR